MTGKEFANEFSNWVLLSITVDKQDNINLVNRLTNRILDVFLTNVKSMELFKKNKQLMDREFDSINKIYHRTNFKLLLSAIMVYIGISIASLVYSIDFKVFQNDFFDHLFSFSLGMFLAFILVIPASSIAGSKKSSAIVGMIFSLLGAIQIYIILELQILPSMFTAIGVNIIFFAFSTLIGFLSGTISGALIDDYFLY